MTSNNVAPVPLPKPSAETRESYVKVVSQFAEKAKQNIRCVSFFLRAGVVASSFLFCKRP